MTQTDNSSIQRPPTSPPVRLAWAFLILATLYICYFHNLGVIGLVGPDEPRYAWIARAMVETGDWITPRLYGKPWFEKPVLYYWGAALSFKLFGVSDAAARLPSAASALLATLAMAWLGLRVCGAETARWLLLLLPTTVGMIGFSHAAATDMPFAAALTIAMVFAARLLGLFPVSSSSSDSFISLASSISCTSLLFGFFLGLAVLAKGPAAIILSGGGVLLWAIFTKRWRDAFRCLHPIAIASFCLTALPWYILCARRNPDFFRVFIIEHNFKRFLTPEFQHIQPFWFYIPIVLIAFLPWTVLLVWSVGKGLYTWRHTRQLSPFGIFLLTWAVFCVIFFSASQSKLPGYILPAIPPIGLLLARSYDCFVDCPARAFRRIQCVGGAVSLLVAFELWTIPFSASRIHAHGATGAGWVLSLLGLANLILAIPPKKPFSGLVIPQMCVLPVMIVVFLFRPLAADFLPRDPSGKSLATEIQKIQRAGAAPDLDYYVARMKRGQQFSLSFYLHREIQDWESVHPADGFVILPSNHCEPPVTPPWSCSRNALELDSTAWFVFRVQKQAN